MIFQLVVLVGGLALITWTSLARLRTMRRIAFATTAPSAPGVPSAPCVPSAPGAPGVPSAPGAPGVPGASDSSAPPEASRLGILTGFVSLITLFMIIRMVLGFPAWAYAVWLPAVAFAAAAAWFAGRAFGRLPWLPLRQGKRQVASAAGETLVAVLIAAAYVAPHLLG
jgi:hypothetical protein